MLPVQLIVSAASSNSSTVSCEPMAARLTMSRTSCNPPNGGA
jgi:hypothetical protein